MDFRKYFVSEYPRKGLLLDQMMAAQNYVSPYVVEESDRHLLQRDVFSTLIEDRIIMFSNDFNQDSCTILTSMLIIIIPPGYLFYFIIHYIKINFNMLF